MDYVLASSFLFTCIALLLLSLLMLLPEHNDEPHVHPGPIAGFSVLEANKLAELAPTALRLLGLPVSGWEWEVRPHDFEAMYVMRFENFYKDRVINLHFLYGEFLSDSETEITNKIMRQLSNEEEIYGGAMRI